MKNLPNNTILPLPYGYIYLTTNSIDNKKYIGKKVFDKWQHWRTYLGSGIHLKRAVTKYGKENFSVQIIEYCFDELDACNKEQYWIKYYDAVNSQDFYNIANGGDGGNVISGYNDEQRQQLSIKLSKARKGKINIGKDNGSARKVICLNTMEKFDTIVEAASYYNISKDAIQQCCSKTSRCKTVKSLDGERLQFEYYEDDKQYVYIPYQRQYPHKQIYCITNNKIYNTVKEASDDTQCSINSIRHCCNNHINATRNGMQFEYVK